MHGYIPRLAEKSVARALRRSPAVAILGPRQCGKSTLAKRILSGTDATYIRTSNRAEIDLVLERGARRRVFEFKASKAPKASRGLYELVRDLAPESVAIVAPVEESYPVARNIRVSTLADAC